MKKGVIAQRVKSSEIFSQHAFGAAESTCVRTYVHACVCARVRVCVADLEGQCFERGMPDCTAHLSAF